MKNRAKSKPAGSDGYYAVNHQRWHQARFWLRHATHRYVKKSDMKNLWFALAIFVATGSSLFANGGAWQTGVRETGNVSASDKDRHTDVAIENESVKIFGPRGSRRRPSARGSR